MKPSKVSKRVFSSNVINSSSSAVLALKSPIRQIFLNFSNASVVDYTICSSEFLKNIVNMSILDFSRLFSDVHSPFRVSINPSQPIREEKTDSTNNRSFKNLQNIKKYEILVYFFRINIIELFRKIIEIVDIYAFYELLGL
jgi:hypothetical protein